jgi:hypothetical protein
MMKNDCGSDWDLNIGQEIVAPFRHCNFLYFRLCELIALLMMVFSSTMPHAQPGSGNLPVYTSPIEITGLKIQLRAVAPDRETGKAVEVALPVGLIGPKMNRLFSTPLSTQIDQYWSVIPNQKTGLIPRQAACDDKDGIKEQVIKEVAKRGNIAYNISCDLASTGQLLVKQVGSTMTLAYLMTKNSVYFTSTSKYSCKNDNGTPFCPNDARFTVRFAAEILIAIRTPSLCQLIAEPNGTVNVVAASFEAHNAAADAAKLVSGQKFVAGEVALTNTVRSMQLPIDDSFKELRMSDACMGKTPGVSRLLSAFSDLETVIDLRQGVILRASHVGIAAPTLDAPNSDGAKAPTVPSFYRPMISTAQPIVTAGNTVQARGQYFPMNSNLATVVPVSLQHGNYGGRSSVGACLGGATEFGWRHAGGAFQVLRLQGDARGNCAASYSATNLTPNTSYQFRARDCDPITCSPWSKALTSTTAKTDASKDNKVALSLDRGENLGTTTVNPNGTFETSITIPAGTSAGAHTIHATNGDANAEVTIRVAASTPLAMSKASIMMVGLLKGETGCPNHPITSTQTDDSFMLFGSGFAMGSVTIRLDSVSGATLGAAPVRLDGSICQRINSVSGDKAGPHTIVAVQNGSVAAKAAVTFVQPSLVR